MNFFLIFKIAEGKSIFENMFFSVSAKMLADNSIPTAYHGCGVCGIAFGENITMVAESDLKKGVIIDAEASRILTEKGIDTGLVEFGERLVAEEEYFLDYDEYIRADFWAYNAKLKDGADIKSTFICKNKEYPLSYYYENSLGYKFLVFNFDAYFNGENIYRSYLRSKQISEAPLLFGQNKLPAYSYGNPDFYILCKKNENSMAVGLFNMFADSIYKPVIELDDKYDDISFVNCTGSIDGDKVYLSDIIPFGFAAFEVSRGR